MEHGPIKLAPKSPARAAADSAPSELPPSDEKQDEDALTDDIPDFRFALERLQEANWPDARKRAENAAAERRAKAGA